MAQGGGYDSELNEKSALFPPIKLEAATALSNTRGTIAMARTNDPNSAGSQFFICMGRVASLDRQYTAFGVTADDESLKNALSIGDIETGPGDRPVNDVAIKSGKVIVNPK